MRSIHTYLTAMLLLPICLAHANAANAGQIRKLSIGNWNGGAYTATESETFHHCSLGAEYNSGISFLISVDRTFYWWIGFTNPAWHLTPGTTLNSAYKIDNSAWRPAQLSAISRSMLEMRMPDETDLIVLFRRGRLITFLIEGHEFHFSLTNTNAAIPLLARCVNEQLSLERGLTIAPATNPSFNSPQPHIADKGDIFRVLSNFLLNAGLSNARILSRSEIPDALRDRGAVWQADGILGCIDFGNAESAAQVSARLIGEDAAACRGRFASGRIPSDTRGVTEVFTACDGSNGFSIRYMILPGASGGMYQFSLITVDPLPESDTLDNLRNAAVTSVR